MQFGILFQSLFSLLIFFSTPFIDSLIRVNPNIFFHSDSLIGHEAINDHFQKLSKIEQFHITAKAFKQGYRLDTSKKNYGDSVILYYGKAVNLIKPKFNKNSSLVKEAVDAYYSFYKEEEGVAFINSILNQSSDLSPKLKWYLYNKMAIYEEFLLAYDTSIKHYLEALLLAEKLADVEKQARVESNVGILFRKIKEYDKGLLYQKKAIDHFEQAMKDSVELIQEYPKFLTNYANTLNLSGKSDEAIPYMVKAVNLWDSLQSDRYYLACDQNNLAHAYLKNGEIENAKKYFSASLENSILENIEFCIASNYYGQSLIKFQKGETKQALTLCEKALKENLKTNRLQNRAEIYELLSKIYEEHGSFKKSNTALKKFITTSKLVEDADAKHRASYIESRFENQKIKQEITALHTKNTQRKTQVYFLCLSILLLGLVGAYWLSRYRNKVKFSKVARQRDLNEYQLQTLKNQMNPHFIFNALNSAQHYILKSEKKSAYQFLSRFSKLIRKVMVQSVEQCISIEDEIEILKSYLELEKIRFGEKLNFKISLENEDQLDGKKIPSMILQPFVENAVLHGLSNKKENGLIEINIKSDDRYMYCSIEDDGVGRLESAKINEQKAFYHKSIASKNISKRVDLLKGLYPEASMDFVDKELPKTGTIVHIKLPIQA